MAKEKTSAKSEAWQYTGEYIQACNCDWGCPCNFGSEPTNGYCEGGYAINITEGAFGKTKLDGIKFAAFAKWPGQIHEGGGTGCVYIDEEATSNQRDALLRIITGKAGGLPWAIVAAVIDNWLEPKYVKFEWKFDGIHSTFKAGPYAHATLEPVRNPVTGEETVPRVVLPNGFTFKEADIGSLKSFAVFDKGLKYAHPGKNSHVAMVRHSNS